MQYRELLQMVMHGLNKPSTDNNQQLGNISRKIAQCVTDLATAAQQLKDDDWVDPSDPAVVAETELLGAAKSIENAARKLSALKPRKEIKGKVRKLCDFFFVRFDELASISNLEINVLNTILAFC